MIELIGYAPDQNPMTPGVITNCAALVPSMRGMQGAPSPASTLLPALSATCQGAAALRKLDTTTRLIVGTGTKLYEASTSSWTDVSRAVGGAYSPAVDVKWRFAQFGNTSLAVQKSDVLQSSSSGAFANVATAPKASIVETVGQFVFLFDTNEGTYGDSPNRWWCSEFGNYAGWTPAVATQCTTGLLTSSAGSIRAGRRFGDQIIVYKDRAMYRGVYTGGAEVWRFIDIPGEIGALSQETVVNIGTPDYPKHIFMGYEDFYIFDGSRAKPIGLGFVKEKVFSEINLSFPTGCASLHDRKNSRVYFYYPSSSSVTPDKCVVYNYRTERWGRDDRTIECALDYVFPGVTYDALGAIYNTYDDLPSVSYDSPIFSSGAPSPAVIDTSHLIKTLTGPATSSSFTSGDMGDPTNFMLLSRVRPVFLKAPTSATMTNYYRNNLGDTLTTDASSALMNGKFDVLRSARWHRVRLDFVGDVEIPGYISYADQDGTE